MGHKTKKKKIKNGILSDAYFSALMYFKSAFLIM